jgi:hypothetical protein
MHTVFIGEVPISKPDWVIFIKKEDEFHFLLINVRGCVKKFPDWVDNEINNNKHSLRSNTEGYGDKTH